MSEVINLRACTENEIVKVAAHVIRTIGSPYYNEDEYKVNPEKLNDLAVSVTAELIESTAFYDYSSNEDGEFVYCLSLPEAIVNKKLISSPVTAEENDFLEESVRDILVSIMLEDIFVSEDED